MCGRFPSSAEIDPDDNQLDETLFIYKQGVARILNLNTDSLPKSQHTENHFNGNIQKSL